MSPGSVFVVVFSVLMRGTFLRAYWVTPSHARAELHRMTGCWRSFQQRDSCGGKNFLALKETIMKAQTTQPFREKKPHTMQVEQPNVPVSTRKAAGSAQAAVDDLHARITARAYELYVERGCRNGYHLEDWLDAERVILDRFVTK
ncbi:MAG: DUF2934 domain-containing protein [Opitutaceae bacterium]|nr:DUF2934 domain-containing protein [Opitutaceae bacterium]